MQMPITLKKVSDENQVEFMHKHLRYDAPAMSFSATYDEFLNKHGNDDQPVLSLDLMHVCLRAKLSGYDSSPCHFYELSNGGFFMGTDAGELTYKGVAVSGEAGGIIATLYALNDCLQKRIKIREQATDDNQKIHTPDDDKLYNQFCALREYAKEHAELAMFPWSK